MKEQRLTFHRPSCTMSLIFSLSSSLYRGPKIRDRSSPTISHLSSQKLSPLSDPTFHLVPCSKICLPLLIPTQVLEQHLLGFAYLSHKTLAQGWSSSVFIHQFSLARSAKFFGLAAVTPSPHSFLGRVILSQLTVCSFLLSSVDYHMKFLLTRSIASMVFPESIVPCITYIGIAERTD